MTVPAVSRWWSFICEGCCQPPLAAYPRASERATLCSPIGPCSKWGLASRRVAPTLVSSYLTISPLPVPGRAIGGVVSVPLSPGHPAWHLASTLPYGARTFLTGYKSRRDHPTHSPIILYPMGELV